MPIFNVPGRGRVQFPEGYSQEEYALAISKLGGADQFQPEFSLGQKAFAPIARTLQNIGTSLTTELPAMGLAAIGRDEQARQLLDEAKQRYAETERMAPRMYQSYEDVTGPLSALGYAYERAGEALPYGLAMLLPGGAAAAGARGAAVRAGTAATEAALARGLPAAAAESLGAARATQVMQRAGLGGAGVGGYALNAPETFAEVARETGELRPGVASVAALGQTFLDLVAPSAFLSKLGMFGKLKAGEEVAKRAGFTEAAKDLAIAAAKTAPKEGLTEAAQEVIGNAAVDFVRGSGELFSPERIKQYLEAGISGGVGGAALGAAGRGIQRIGMPVEQPAPAQQAAVEQPQVTQPVTEDPLLKYKKPSAEGFTPSPVIDQGLTPEPSSVGFQVPPEIFTETPVDQKYFDQFVADIMAGIPRTTPEDQQFYANNAPAVEQRLREAQAAPALPAPGPQPTSDLNIPVPEPEVLQLAAPQEAAPEALQLPAPEAGPPEFVEPPPMEGTAPLPEDVATAMDIEQELIKQRAEIEKGKGSLWTALKGRISIADIKDATPDPEFRFLAGKQKSKGFKGLDLMVADGDLDAWLPYNLRSEFRSQDPSLAIDGVNHIKDRLASKDLLTEETKQELKQIGLQLDEALSIIRTYENEFKRNLAAAEAAAEGRAEKFESAEKERVVSEQVEQAVPEGEEGVAGPREAPGEFEDRKVVTRTVFRTGPSSLSGMDKKISAKDVINYETEELGNEDIEIVSDKDLASIPANELAWVTFDRESAENYINEEAPEEDRGEITSRKATFEIIAKDSQGGYLIREVAEPVTFTPSSYAEQMMDGTLPDTDEAYAYFQENQQEIEQALSDLEERRAQPMMKATASQKSTANQVAKRFSGSVVWQDGDVSLIQAYSSLTGDPVYIVSKGGFTNGVDVDSDRVTFITPQQKSQLIAVKNSLEKKAKDFHDKSPFIQFGGDGLVFSQTVPKELKGIVEGWKKLLKIQANIYVTNKDDIAANVNKFTGPHRAIASDLNASKDNIGSMRKMADGNYYIIFSKDVSNLRMMETLAHELGHIHERETFNNADLATKRAVRDEFDKFLASRKGASAREYIGKMRARAGFKRLEIAEGLQAERLNPYWFKFSEWYADQVSRWATTSEKPLTVVEKFFKRLADALKAFYAKLRNQKYLPNETFKQYMDKVSASVNDIAPARVEAKPLGVKDQMALFMRAMQASPEKDIPKLIEDIPNDDWLQGKIDYAIRKGRNDYGVPFMSTVTGYFRKPVEVPLRVLSKLKGERDEQNNVREGSLKYIRDNWDEVSKEPPYIEVAYNGEAWVSEGNHRIMVAAEKGLESLPVEIRYFDGGQRRLGPLHPLRIPSLDEAYSLEPSDTEVQYMRRGVEGFTEAAKDLSPQEQQDLFSAVDKIDDTPAEGMKSMDTMIKDTPSFEATKDKLRQFVSDASMNSSKNLMSFLNMRQLSELAKKELPQFAEYYRVLTNMLNDRDAKLTVAAKTLQEWQDWSNKNPVLGKALDEVMLDARMSGIDPTDPIKAEKIKKESFRKNWEMIKGTEGEKLFIKIRDFYKSQLTNKRDIIKNRLMTAMPDGPVRQANLLKLREQFEKFLEDGPYFPLNRFGDYFVAYDVRLPSGDVVPYHEMFESQADQRAHLQSIEKDIASGKVKNLKTGVDSKELFSQGVIKSAFLNDIFDAIDKTDVGDLVATDTKARLKDDIYQAYLSIMPDLSVHKHFIHAKKVRGASMDMKRAFAETVFHSTYHLARLEYGGSLDAILGDAQKYFNERGGNARGRYLNELKQQHAEFSAPQKQNPIWSKISNFAFMFYLTAPASALVNLTQTPIIGMPTLAGKFNVSFAKASAALYGASKDFMSSRTKLLDFDLEGQLRKAGKTFEADALKALESTVNRTQTLSLAGIAERPSSLYASGIRGAMQSKGLGIFEKVSLGLGYMFNQAEIFNRQVTALAAIRLAREINAREVAAGRVRKYGDGEIIGLARDLVDQIHFEYASETKPRFMRGPIGQVVLQFKNYAQQMTYLLVDTFKKAFLSNAELEALRIKSLDTGLSEADRADAKRVYNDALMLRKEARKKFTGIMGMTALFAGYEGLPLYWVIEGVMNTLFGDDDEPYDFSLEMKVAMAELFGDNFARAMSRGPMSELLQIDLASRTSLNGIWFRDDATAKDEEEWVKNMVIDLLGPSVGIVVNTGDAIKKINEGHYARGLEAMSPPILKDFFKAYRFSTEGATTMRGDPIVADVGLLGIFAQAVGFTPQDVARSYEAMGEIKGIEKALDQRRTRLLGKLWLAQQAGDYEAFSELGEQIIKFNAANPTEAIDDKTIRRSFAQREKAAARAERGIIVSPKREYLLEKTVYLDEE